jgi:hypothetical protein
MPQTDKPTGAGTFNRRTASPMLSFTFNTGQLADQLKRYVAATRRDAADALEWQAEAMCSGVGKGRVPGLFQEARREEGNVRAAIIAAAGRGPLRRPKGRSWKAEYEKRLKYAALIQASGWLNTRYGNKRPNTHVRGLRSIANPPGKVVARLNGSEPVIEITNTQPRALEFAMATGYVDRAIKNRIDDMQVYIDRKLAESAKEF